MASNALHTAVAIPRDPTAAEIVEFMATRNGAEMARLMHSINDPSAQHAFATALGHSPTDATAAPQDSPEAPKNKKALNAFVAFRSYHIHVPEFKPWPMKKLSHILALLWDTDPNKVQWALLAKTWSLIRDQIGKDRAPLAKYLKIMCPAMKIPSPEVYLEQFGWELHLDEKSDPRVSRSSVPPQTSHAVCNMSIADIIRYCHNMGFAQEFDLDEAVTPSTFQVQLNPAPKNGEEIIDSMLLQRSLTREKRRANRKLKRDAGLPQALKKRVNRMHAFEETLTAESESSELDFASSDWLMPPMQPDPAQNAPLPNLFTVPSQNLMAPVQFIPPQPAFASAQSSAPQNFVAPVQSDQQDFLGAVQPIHQSIHQPIHQPNDIPNMVINTPVNVEMTGETLQDFYDMMTVYVAQLPDPQPTEAGDEEMEHAFRAGANGNMTLGPPAPQQPPY